MCVIASIHAPRGVSITKRLALLNAGVASLTLAGWAALRPPEEISAVTDVLFPFSIGLATYFGGRINGALWLIVPSGRLALYGGADATVSFLECVLLYIFTSVVIMREARASRTRDQLRALIASMRDVILVLDGDGNYVEVAQSPGLIKPAGELTGRNLRDVFAASDSAFFLQKIEEALATGETVTVDYSLIIDGTPFWFSAAVSPMPGRQVVWVARDVTEAQKTRSALERFTHELEDRIAARTRDLAETIDALHGEAAGRIAAIAALTESQERFELSARATNDVFWDWDLTSGALWFSDSYRDHFGSDPPDIDEHTARIHAEDRDLVSRKLQAALDYQDVKFVVQYRYRHADGTYAVVLDRGYVSRDESRQPKRVVGAMIDLSEHHQLVERLEQEKRVSSLGRIAASIAHEFNNITMSIQSNLEVVKRYADQRVEASLNHVFGAIQRSKTITEQILRYTRPAPPETRSVDVIRLLEDWKNEISASMPPSVEISVQVADPDLRVEADPLQIAQLLTNLAINARDAMPSGSGRIAIEAFAECERRLTNEDRNVVHIRISDTGKGMTPQELANSFEPLYTTKRHGTGLGLVISRQIATQHGGYLSAESVAGEGTTFHLTLPASNGTDVQQPCPLGEVFLCRRILLVEDDPAVAAGLMTLLQSINVEVIVAHDGADGIALALQSPPDCLILDVGLPDMDGTEVFERVREQLATLPIIFSSGHADASRLRQYLESDRGGATCQALHLCRPHQHSERNLQTVHDGSAAARLLINRMALDKTPAGTKRD